MLRSLDSARLPIRQRRDEERVEPGDGLSPSQRAGIVDRVTVQRLVGMVDLTSDRRVEPHLGDHRDAATVLLVECMAGTRRVDDVPPATPSRPSGVPVFLVHVALGAGLDEALAAALDEVEGFW